MRKAPQFPAGYIPEYHEVAGTDYSGPVYPPSMADALKRQMDEERSAAERNE